MQLSRSRRASPNLGDIASKNLHLGLWSEAS